MPQHNWRTEIIKQSEHDELLDYIEVEPGPAMRGHLSDFFNQRGVLVFLLVHHRPSGLSSRAPVRKEQRRYTAQYDREWLTLEEATKRMRRDLEGRWRPRTI